MKIAAPSKIPLTEKLALTVADAALLASVGRSQIYIAVSSGELPARKRGCSTLILPADLAAWIASLPSFKTDHAKPRGGRDPHEIHKRRMQAAE
jgi:excisionase family DNA binding protein